MERTQSSKLNGAVGDVVMKPHLCKNKEAAVIHFTLGAILQFYVVQLVVQRADKDGGDSRSSQIGSQPVVNTSLLATLLLPITPLAASLPLDSLIR